MAAQAKRTLAAVRRSRVCGLAGIGWPHSTATAAQVRPAPKPTITSLSPAFTRPLPIASHRAIGIDAEDVFP